MLNNSIIKELALQGLTLSQLAKKVDVSEETIVTVSNKAVIPSIMLAMKISKVLKKDTEDIFQLSEKGLNMVKF